MSGRFTSLPLVASNSICSSSLIEGSFWLSFNSLYTKPLVLKNFFTGSPLRGIHVFNSSTLGLSSTIRRLVYSMLFSVSHFFAFWQVLHRRILQKYRFHCMSNICKSWYMTR